MVHIYLIVHAMEMKENIFLTIKLTVSLCCWWIKPTISSSTGPVENNVLLDWLQHRHNFLHIRLVLDSDRLIDDSPVRVYQTARSYWIAHRVCRLERQLSLIAAWHHMTRGKHLTLLLVTVDCHYPYHQEDDRLYRDWDRFWHTASICHRGVVWLQCAIWTSGVGVSVRCSVHCCREMYE